MPEEAPAAAGVKRPAPEADAGAATEEPAAKQAKVEAAPAPAAEAPAAPVQRRPRKNQNHPAAVAARKAARKAAEEEEEEIEVLFPVGQSPSDLPIPRRLRTATPRRPRSSRAAWGRLKQVGAACLQHRWPAGQLLGRSASAMRPGGAFGCMT